MFHYGPQAARLPFGNGWRCVNGGFRLPQVGPADANGHLSQLVDFSAPPEVAGPGKIAPGSTWYFQCWYRDNGVGAGFDLTDGLRVVFYPQTAVVPVPWPRVPSAARASSLSLMRYPAILLGLLAALFALLAIEPLDRTTWALESSLLVFAVATLWATRQELRFSNAAYTLILAFCVLHVVGAHYTYTQVPYDRWWESLFGRTLTSVFGWQRNHYDRLVHLCFGLLLAYPMRELFLRLVEARGAVSYLLPIQMTLSWSALYEVIEWLAALAFGEGTGAAYVGTQGDEWDAQKDMALAGSGAVTAMLATYLLSRWRGRDEQSERSDSRRRAQGAAASR